MSKGNMSKENLNKENNHKGHRARMREDFDKLGFESWQKHKVLEYLLFQVIPVADTNETAHEMINKCGSFANVFRVSKEQLVDIKGVGEKTADYIHTLGEFVRYYNKTRYDSDTFILDSENCDDYMLDLFDGKNRENLYMICLDPMSRIINQELIYEGTFEEMSMDMPKILRIAVRCDATYVVFAHNHPNGIAKPSQSDIVATQALERVLYMAGIKVIDHVIVGGGKCASIRDYLAENKTAKTAKKRNGNKVNKE